ncbi:MAG TPA: DinB family protein [Stellaceae bacterium]|nr:DinB family protein [Stellaceae bacterium]
MRDSYCATFARYNAWANQRLYDACAHLPEPEYMEPRPAFFGSIHATLNHLLVGDRIWLGRIEGRVERLALNQILYGDFTALRVARVAEDERLIRTVASLDAAALDQPLDYLSSAGERRRVPLRLVLGHLFNHQTHHRGQVHGLLSQTRVAPPGLDLIDFLR